MASMPRRDPDHELEALLIEGEQLLRDMRLTGRARPSTEALDERADMLGRGIMGVFRNVKPARGAAHTARNAPIGRVGTGYLF
jgi:hypothetical protein